MSDQTIALVIGLASVIALRFVDYLVWKWKYNQRHKKPVDVDADDGSDDD